LIQDNVEQNVGLEDNCVDDDEEIVLLDEDNDSDMDSDDISLES